MRNVFSRKHFILLIWPVSFICLLIAKLDADSAEYFFAKAVSKAYLQFIGFITGILPFSLAELTVILVPPLLIFLLIRFIIKTIRSSKDTRLHYIVRSFLNFLCVCGIIFFMFVIGCGVNYYRYTFTYYSGYEIQASPVTELRDMCHSLAEYASDLRAQLTNEDSDNAFESKYSNNQLAGLADDAYDKLGDKYEILHGLYPKPKPVIFSEFLSRLNITGIFFPFTGEANVNVDIPDYSVPSTMCHELAHLRGFMREDEANYLAYLACTASDDTEFKYSGTMLALIISGNALYAQNKDMYYDLYATYSEGVKRDLRANSDYWEQYEDTVLSEAAEKVNDTYLKLNDQEDGVKSYGRMVDLLLAEYRDTGFNKKNKADKSTSTP